MKLQCDNCEHVFHRHKIQYRIRPEVRQCPKCEEGLGIPIEEIKHVNANKAG